MASPDSTIWPADGAITPLIICGTGADVADKLEEWFRAGACDGFMLQTPYVPGGLEDFVRLVIPELQKRELFRRDYEGTTLRDHLGLVRPPA